MRRAGSVSSSFSPSSCREIFSIHGNITLRKDPSGIVASFKVMTERGGGEGACLYAAFWHGVMTLTGMPFFCAGIQGRWNGHESGQRPCQGPMAWWQLCR
jgi:hypothetical protein